MRWILIAVVLSLAVAWPAAAQAPEGGRRQIVTTGQGEIQVTPDQATVSVGAQAQRNTAADASAEVNRVANQVLARWQALGIRRDDIRTSAVQVFPVFTTPRDGSPPQISGYRATYMLTAITTVAQVGPAIDAAVGAGANTVHGVSFGLKDPAKARSDALGMAVREARSKAEAIARAAGLRIRAIERIVEGGVGIQTRELRVQPGQVAAPTPIEPGLVSVTAQVTVIFGY